MTNQRVKAIYLHWTAGSYTWTSPRYHTNILGNGTIKRITPYNQKLYGHTWGRNTDSVALSCCCMRDGQPHGAWPVPPTPKQVEAMCLEAARIALKYGIPMDEKHILTHAEAANLDDYGLGSQDPNTRWDFIALDKAHVKQRDGGQVLRGKIRWYLEQLKLGKVS